MIAVRPINKPDLCSVSGAYSMDEVPGVVKVTEPLLVFGGPSSNLEATKAILEEARRQAIPPGNIVCTGDLAAYCADPQGVIDLLRNSGIRILMGDCEEALAAQATECGCGFAADSVCAALSGQWYPYADRNIDAEGRLWIGSLPRQLHFEVNGRPRSGTWRRHHPQSFHLREQRRGDRGGIGGVRLRRRHRRALRSALHL
jgi:hypothetical protein